MRTLLLLLALAACSDPADVVGDTDTGDTDVTDAAVRFAFPVPERTAIDPNPIGVDHDPATADGLLGRAMCVNYAGDGFPHCYDQHEGSDFILRGGFDAMDAGSALVAAAADGTIVDLVDGNYDRCHASIEKGDVDCDGHEMVANKIEVEHADGTSSLYLHLKSGSLRVAVGDVVTEGEPLALIGSSGRSSFPHLHFEVHTPEGVVVDPFAGTRSQPESLWCEQEHGDGLPGPCDP